MLDNPMIEEQALSEYLLSKFYSFWNEDYYSYDDNHKEEF